MNNRNIIIIVTLTTLALGGIVFYYYRKYTEFKPTAKSKKYSIVIELND